MIKSAARRSVEGGGDELRPMSVIVPWRPGLWLVEAARNLRASPLAGGVLCALFVLILAGAVALEQGTIRRLTDYEESLRHDGGWSLVVEPSENALISGPRCERLAAFTGVAGSGAIINRNGRASMLDAPGSELSAPSVSPSLIRVLSGEVLAPKDGLVGGQRFSEEHGRVSGSLVSIVGSGEKDSQGIDPINLRIVDLSRLGVVSDAGLAIVEYPAGYVDACVVDFEPNVPDEVQRSLASFASEHGRQPKVTGFVAVPTGDQSLSNRYRQRSSRFMPIATAFLGAVVALGSFIRRRPELAMYQLAGARSTTSRLVILGELALLLMLAGSLVLVGFLIAGLTVHGIVQLLACQLTCLLAAMAVGFLTPLGSLAEALKDS